LCGAALSFGLSGCNGTREQPDASLCPDPGPNYPMAANPVVGTVAAAGAYQAEYRSCMMHEALAVSQADGEIESIAKAVETACDYLVGKYAEAYGAASGSSSEISFGLARSAATAEREQGLNLARLYVVHARAGHCHPKPKS
jgi:hypothetical protein